MNRIITFFSLLCIFFGELSGVTAEKLKVCVIGTGPSGISALRYLADHRDKFEIKAFEKAAEVGGQWLYTNYSDIDQYGNPVHSGMYKNLKIDNPKELTVFQDWIEFSVNETFPTHYVMNEYLINYTDHFKLRDLIEFHTEVVNVSSLSDDKWAVTTKNVTNSINKTQTFDAVIVCNGHYFNMRFPTIPGMENFKGQIMHSHAYREPSEMFRNKTVIVTGGGTPKINIARQLRDVAAEVYLSLDTPKLPHPDINQVKGIIKFENDQFVLKDNTSISADIVIFCTGYFFSYPFLDNTTGITVDDNFVYPLYKQIINVEHPSMSFIGIPKAACNWPFFAIQAQFAVAVLEGKVELPSKSEMLEDATCKTVKKRYGHILNDTWAYSDELAKMAGFPSIPESFKSAFLAFKANATHH